MRHLELAHLALTLAPTPTLATYYHGPPRARAASRRHRGRPATDGLAPLSPPTARASCAACARGACSGSLRGWVTSPPGEG
eukprot:scaffold58294_cov30-Phaeocystis_antarctica.AAC.2